jgi:hypothetical protein
MKCGLPKAGAVLPASIQAALDARTFRHSHAYSKHGASLGDFGQIQTACRVMGWLATVCFWAVTWGLAQPRLSGRDAAGKCTEVCKRSIEHLQYRRFV